MGAASSSEQKVAVDATQSDFEEADYEKVVEAVEKGDSKAKTKLAWYLLSGCGGAKVDGEKAVELLEERVKEEDSEAMWMLGLCNEYGMGCEQDIGKAETLYKQSSDKGNKKGEFLAVNGKDNRGSGVMHAEGLQQ